MKKLSLLFIALMICSTGLMAQRSAVKLGLGGLLVTAPNLRYEQALGDRMSFQITGSYKFPSRIINNVMEEGLLMNNVGNSGFAIIPELRFYFGKAKAGTIEGFYVAPYLKYHRYRAMGNYPFDYTRQTGEVVQLSPDLSASLATFGAGVQVGYHWVIGEHFSIDWHFLGLGGDAHRLRLRSEFQRDDLDLRDVAKEVRDRINAELDEASQLPITDEEIDALPIDGNSFNVLTPFASVGFRAGLSIGYAF